MTDAQQRNAAKQFAADWKGKGYEKGESQPFWLVLLRNVYGIEQPKQYVFFEEQGHLDHTSFIDGSIPDTHVLIEQKAFHVYDMECSSGEPEVILLKDFGKEYYRLQFLVDNGDSNIKRVVSETQ